MPPRFRRAVLCLIGLSTAAGSAYGQEAHKGHSPAEMNRQFVRPDLDVREFIRRFESESRDIYVAREKIVDAVGLRPGMAVADIGAGTGLFTWRFAEQVGPKGTVYAVEIAPAFLRYIDEQSRERHVDNVKTVRSTQESTNLAPGSIDVAFVCATYHHFERPEKVLASIHRALRPGGRLVLIDFDPREDSSEFVRKHARGPKDVVCREVCAAGFAQVPTKPSVSLKDNFMAVFQTLQSEDRPSDEPRKP